MRRLPPKVKPPSLSTHYRSTRHGTKLELVSVKRRAKVQTPHHQDPGASADFRKTREEGDLQWYSIEGVNNCAESRTETITFFDATYPYKRYQFSASVVQCTFLQLVSRRGPTIDSDRKVCFARLLLCLEHSAGAWTPMSVRHLRSHSIS
jgi:hypothetical protein